MSLGLRSQSGDQLEGVHAFLGSHWLILGKSLVDRLFVALVVKKLERTKQFKTGIFFRNTKLLSHMFLPAGKHKYIC